MFPSNHDQIDEFIFDDLPPLSVLESTLKEDQPMTDASVLEQSGSIIGTIGKKEQKVAVVAEENNDRIPNEKKPKRIHREIERKRRQEMANLHTSLRTQLPLEYIKGKRSVSDHIHESVNYINNLEKTIKELSIKRDKLQKMSKSNFTSTSITSSTNSAQNNNVTISSCFCGIEILITSTISEEVFPSTRLLRVMLEEGLDVVSYISSQVNERLLVTIKSKVDNSTSVDISLLQQKLADSIRLQKNY